MSRAMLKLVPADGLIKTNDLDQAHWNHQPGPLGYIQRQRFALAGRLLDAHPSYGDLLEVGYGSGIFLPELARRCRKLHGVDVHQAAEAVGESLTRYGVEATLATAPAEALPYVDASFDAVASISSLEFVDDVDRVCLELKRVLRPGGVGVFVTPGHSGFLDAGLEALTGERAEETFRGRRQLVLPTIRRHFRVQREIRFPKVPRVWLYTAVMVRG